MGTNYASVLLLFLAVAPVLPQPTPNGTYVRSEPAFVPNPTGRGTIEVIFSCIVTLGLCIWTAVHPDVVANKTILGHLIYKTSWMMTALVVPEIVVSNSFHQWREAKRVHAKWCTLSGIKKGSKEDMGMEGAFFVVMGGCTIGGIDDGFTATITPAGFLALTQSGTLPNDVLKKGIIKDKGKADALAKLLVCVQAIWMAVQCLARKLNFLPVTLLEYHVVIQVLYAMAMYKFWWHKPKDVNEPIEVIQRTDISDDDFANCVTMVPQVKRFIVDDLITLGFDGHTDALTAAILGIPTSAFHLLAWNSHFPSPAEKWIWRISSIGIGVAPQCMYLHFLASRHIVGYTWGSKEGDPLYRRVHKLIMDKFPTAPGVYRTINSPLEMNFGEIIFYLTTWLNIHAYTTFSLLLGVVAFISIRNVPEGSYDTVVWADYWPHF